MTLDGRLGDRLNVTGFSRTTFVRDGADADVARRFALDLVNQVVELNQLYDLPVDLRPVDWKPLFAPAGTAAAQDLRIIDGAVKSQLFSAGRRGLHLMWLDIPGIGWRGYLKSVPRLKRVAELRLVDGETLAWLGIPDDDEEGAQRTSDSSPRGSASSAARPSMTSGRRPSWTRSQSSLRARTARPSTTGSGCCGRRGSSTRTLRGGTSVGRRVWQVSPNAEGMLDVLGVTVDLAAIPAWLLKKGEPPSQDIQQRLVELQALLA